MNKTKSGSRKIVIISYKTDDATGMLTGSAGNLQRVFDQAGSRQHKKVALVTQAPTLDQLKVRATDALNLLLSEAQRPERAEDFSLRYRKAGIPGKQP